MSESAARTIGFGGALLEQLRWFWHRLWTWIVISTALVSGAAVWIVGSVPDDAGPIAYLLLGSAFHPLLVLIALSWALSAWRDDPPKDRQYFWLQPVERIGHTVARTLAGLIWLMLVTLIVLTTVYLLSRGMVPETMAGAATRTWLFAIASVALAYVAASIPAVLSDRPHIWIILVIAIVVIASAVAAIRQIQWLMDALSWLIGGPLSFGTALGAPGAEATRLMGENMPAGTTIEGPGMGNAADARPGLALLIWTPVTIAAYLGAVVASRPR